MKKKVLLSSILTIALCFSLIAGSTFALFTSESKQNIAVTAGKVNVAAGIDALTLYSVKGDENGTVVDENGNKYVYETKTNGTFTNGGTAVYDEATGVLTLDKITPGDKVSFSITGKNNSDVAIQYRYSVACTDGYTLMDGLVVSIGNTNVYTSLASYTSDWMTLAPNTDMTAVTVVIAFPVTAGNEYQSLSTSIDITVEAVQGNAVTEGSEEVVHIATAASLEEIIAAGGNNVEVNGNETTIYDVIFTSNAIGNGHYGIDKSFKFVNCTFTGDNGWCYADNATYENCTFDCGSANAAVHFDELVSDAVFNNCKFISGRIQIGAAANATPTVTFTNCEFSDVAGESIWSDKGIRVYCDATFENCEFGNRVVLAGSNGLPITFTSCTMNGGSAVYYHDNTDGIIRGGNIPAVTINN